MSANFDGPPREIDSPCWDGPSSFSSEGSASAFDTLGALPLGARLVMRCRVDWREATVVGIATDKITLSVAARRGTTYRVRRPPDSALLFYGSIPLLGKGAWRHGLLRYDERW